MMAVPCEFGFCSERPRLVLLASCDFDSALRKLSIVEVPMPAFPCQFEFSVEKSWLGKFIAAADVALEIELYMSLAPVDRSALPVSASEVFLVPDWERQVKTEEQRIHPPPLRVRPALSSEEKKMLKGLKSLVDGDWEGLRIAVEHLHALRPSGPPRI